MNQAVRAYLGHDLARYMDRSFLAGRRAHRPGWDFLSRHPLSPEVDRHVDWLVGSNHGVLETAAPFTAHVVAEISALAAAIRADEREDDPRLERLGQLGQVLAALDYLVNLEGDDAGTG